MTWHTWHSQAKVALDANSLPLRRIVNTTHSCILGDSDRGIAQTMTKFWAVCRQPFLYNIWEELPVTRPCSTQFPTNQLLAWNNFRQVGHKRRTLFAPSRGAQRGSATKHGCLRMWKVSARV